MSVNRFSYNLAVSEGSNSVKQQNLQNDANKRNLSAEDDPYIKNEKITNRKMHQQSSSSGSSILFDLNDLEEEDLSTINEHFDWLIPGEEIQHKELNVGFHKQDLTERIVLGRVYVTNYRLRFVERFTTGRKEPQQQIIMDITLGTISKVEKMGYYNVRRNTAGNTPPYGVNIICKDIRNIRFIHRRQSHGRRALYESLRRYAFPNSNRLPFFANLYRAKFHSNGWELFDVMREFNRQKVPNTAWRPSQINKNYNFAATYPSIFYVPSEVFNQKSPDEFMQSVSVFRSKKRIPVLSWIDYRTLAALVRSSQPMVGALPRKSASDEDYIEMIINANPNSRYMTILDARPSINAKANRASGGGYENYSRCELHFMDIQNIHVVRDSLKKLKNACFPRIRQKYFQLALQETKWLAHLQTILEAAALAAHEISRKKNSVLVHCSDGWDRTAQITSLAMLQLDSYYRTIEGFAVLVEKEWCSFGHKFAHRIGHGQEKPDDKERSPIFVQFIDCVWQLYNQFTSSFEFNVQFLKTILDELYSCRFGTFLYNNERERVELQVKQNTASLWSFIIDNRLHFINEKYVPDANLDDFIAQRVRIHPLFWTDYYCRHSLLLPQDKEDQNSRSSMTPSDFLSLSHDEPVQLFSNIRDQNKEYTKMNYVNVASSNHSTVPDLPQHRESELIQKQIRIPPSSAQSNNLYMNELKQLHLQRQGHFTHSSRASPDDNKSSPSSVGSNEIITRV